MKYEILIGYVECLMFGMCKNCDIQNLWPIMSTIYAGAQICLTEIVLGWFENNFLNLLIRTDFENMSFADHLEHYLNRQWVEENSFCLDGKSKLGAAEVFAEKNGLCFYTNSVEKIYTRRYFFDFSHNLEKSLFNFILQCFQFCNRQLQNKVQSQQQNKKWNDD